MVEGTTFNDFQASVPVYGNSYVIQVEKNAKAEIEKQITADLSGFFALYMKNNSQNLSKIIFYCED